MYKMIKIENIQSENMRKEFKLPKLGTGSIDEVMAQLDLATFSFAAHQTIQEATEVSIASRRYVLAIESAQKRGELDLTTIQIFFKDITMVREQFARIMVNYKQRMAYDANRNLDNYLLIQRDYDIMDYYLRLLSDQTNRVIRLTRPKNDNE
jgi:hypothetical protein